MDSGTPDDNGSADCCAHVPGSQRHRSDLVPDLDSYGHLYSCANSDAHGHCYADADVYPGAHPNADADADKDAVEDAYSDSNTGTHRYGYGDSDPQAYAYGRGHRDARTCVGYSSWAGASCEPSGYGESSPCRLYAVVWAGGL